MESNQTQDQQFKRNTAYKFRIGDLLIGKPTMDGDKFKFLELGDKKIVRVNIIGNIVDKFDTDGEKKYSTITVDDGSGQIKLKTFGDDVERIKPFVQGQTVLTIGVLRHWNDEIYIAPEVTKEMDPKYLLVRKLEIEKSRSKNFKAPEKQEIIAIKDKILELIKGSEEEGGIETEQLILKLRETSPELINQELKKMLEEGIIFEPRPGKVRWLG